jgi:signal peptidase II
MNDVVRFEYTENVGAFMGLGTRLPEGIRTSLLVATVSVSLVVASAFAIGARSIDRFQFIGLALIVSGGIGNLIDRLSNDGAVVDFVSVGAGRLRTGVFNVADVAVTTGVIVILLLGMKGENVQWPKKEKEQKNLS